MTPEKITLADQRIEHLGDLRERLCAAATNIGADRLVILARSLCTDWWNDKGEAVCTDHDHVWDDGATGVCNGDLSSWIDLTGDQNVDPVAILEQLTEVLETIWSKEV